MIGVEGLSKTYGSTRALDDVSFTVPAGQVTGFLGPNGAGKSTLMRILMGLESADRGRAHFDGVAFNRSELPLRTAGALLDPGAVHPGRRARDHLRVLAASNGLPPERVEEALTFVGLTGVARGRVGSFSLGMRQRLGVAAALLGRPRHLVLDEPVNGLDPDGVAWIRRFVRDYAAGGNAVLLSSHLIGEVALTVDRLVVIGRGRVLAQGTIEEVVGHGGLAVQVDSVDNGRLAAALRHAGISTTVTPAGLQCPDVETVEISRIAHDAGLLLTRLVQSRESLEEAYLRLTAPALTYNSTDHAPGEAV